MKFPNNDDYNIKNKNHSDNIDNSDAHGISNGVHVIITSYLICESDLFPGDDTQAWAFDFQALRGCCEYFKSQNNIFSLNAIRSINKILCAHFSV